MRAEQEQQCGHSARRKVYSSRREVVFGTSEAARGSPVWIEGGQQQKHAVSTSVDILAKKKTRGVMESHCRRGGSNPGGTSDVHLAKTAHLAYLKPDHIPRRG